MSTINRGPLGSAYLVGRESGSSAPSRGAARVSHPARRAARFLSSELLRSIAEVKGRPSSCSIWPTRSRTRSTSSSTEHDDSQNAFLCRVLGMYSAQLESKHQGLGDRIAETCQEVYVTVREFDQA